MTLLELLALGRERIVGLAKSGQLDPAFLWVALRGAARYAQAVASGDVADDATARERVAVCSVCPVHDVVATSKAGVFAGYCGTSDVPGVSCGCLVTLTVFGDDRTMTAAGKTLVGSERCPRGKW